MPRGFSARMRQTPASKQGHRVHALKHPSIEQFVHEMSLGQAKVNMREH